MARVAAFVPDLLFGSNVIGSLRAAGHEAVLVSTLHDVCAGSADVLVVDLTADAPERIEQVRAAEHLDAVVKLAFYSHVEADVRAAAQAAGFELVVPRSRMAREGAALVTRLAGG
jgi:nucleoside-diphosphate-sugar epimerase